MEHPHPRCQSCGMPLGKKKTEHGTNADGTMSDEYCLACFQHGVFIQPNLTLEEAVANAIRMFTHDHHLDEDRAQVLARATIPTLKRWKRHHENL